MMTTMAAPQITYGAPLVQTIGAPAVEIDRVDGFGQVVERDFVQGAQQVIGGGAVIGTQVFETIVPEVVKTTGQKFIEVPQMVVTK